MQESANLIILLLRKRYVQISLLYDFATNNIAKKSFTIKIDMPK